MDKGYIQLQTEWSKVKDCRIHFEDNKDMECLFIWFQDEEDMIIHGWTLHYEPMEDTMEEELSRDFDAFLDGFLNEGDEEN